MLTILFVSGIVIFLAVTLVTLALVLKIGRAVRQVSLWLTLLASRQYHGSIAGNVSQSMAKKGERGIWQRRFWEHTIRDEADYEKHCDYIHYNPVKHGLVSTPSDWRYSSFAEFVEKGVYGIEWGKSVPDRIAKMNVE